MATRLNNIIIEKGESSSEVESSIYQILKKGEDDITAALVVFDGLRCCAPLSFHQNALNLFQIGYQLLLSQVRLIPETKNVSLEFISRNNKSINKLHLICMGKKQDNVIQLFNNEINSNCLEIIKDYSIKEISLEISDSDNYLLDFHPFASFIGG